MKLNIIIPAATLAVGAAGGFIIGQSNSSSEASSNSLSELPTSSKRSIATSLSGPASTSDRRASSRPESLQDVLSTPGQNDRIQAMLDYYAQLAPSLFESEARSLERLPFGERMIAMQLLFSQWGEKDPITAMSYTDSMGMMGRFVNGTVLKSWASTDPVNASQYYLANSSSFDTNGRGPSPAGTIASEWARIDPKGALTWANSLPDGDQAGAMRGIFSQTAKVDPSEAALQAATITNEDARSQAYQSIAREWGAQDWGEAQAWINTLPADARDEANAQALRGLAADNPKLAAENVSLLPDGDEKNSTIRNISQQWAREDPAATALWVMEQESTDAQGSAMSEVMSSWARLDNDGAIDWLNNQEAGDVRDTAATAFVRNNNSKEYDISLQVAETISDEGTRARSISSAVSTWMKDDPEAAKEYINTSEYISDDERERVLRRATSTGGRGGPGGGRGRGGR